MCLSLRFHFPAAAAALAGTVATSDFGGWQSAVCAEHPMAEGAHYVEMTLLKKGRGLYGAMMGVVGQGFDAAGGGEAMMSAEGWMLSTDHGVLGHAGTTSDWKGMPRQNEIKPGDVFGLLLDLGQRTLSVYLNGAPRGVMIAGPKAGRGLTAKGPLRWAVAVCNGSVVRIERRPPPPSPPPLPLYFSVAGPEVTLRLSSKASPLPSPSFMILPGIAVRMLDDVSDRPNPCM
jgi:hypothetical protein